MKGKAKNLINLLVRDSKEKNESNKRVLMIRLLSIVMFFYFLLLLLLFCFSKESVLVIACSICGLGHIGVLGLTYKRKSVVAYVIQDLITVVWIVFFVLLLGWDCGVQHFIFAMVVFACFATFDNIGIKMGYIIFLCAMRLCLYFYTRTYPPVYSLTEVFLAEFQIINTITIFVCITIISMIIGNYSQEAEKKLVLYNKKLEKMANLDELTGLMNRRSMMLALEQEYNIGTRECTDSIAIGDIDYFKKINDQYGHDCGDVVLKELSKVLEEGMKDRGKVARWGGEEFLFVFEHTNGDNALIYLWDIVYKIRNMKISYGELEITITMTFGLEEYNGVNYEETIRKADDKLYMGKNKGRNQIVY